MNGENQQENGKTMSKKKKIIIAISTILVLIVGLISAFFINVKNEVDSWENKIYPGVQSYGVDLGGKTKEEAVEILNNELINLISNKIIKVTVGDKSFELKYSDINPTISSEETIDKALEYAKNESLFKKKSMIKDGVDYKVETVLSYDEEKIKEFANEVNSQVKVNAVNAKISINGSNISVTPEKNGKDIDVEELSNKIKEAINPDPASVENVNVDLKDYAPKVLAADLNKVDGVISSFSTSFSSSDANRVENLRVACKYINGTVLMPGEEFSYNKTIGPTTPERGYKEGNAYSNGEVIKDYGGGVCQVSSTLYRAIIQANIKSTERRNHSMTVGYAKPGLDATVASGYIDYKFVNTYDFPIYLQGYLSGNNVVFNIYGNKAGMGGKTYKLISEIVETYNYNTKEVKDANLEEGKTVVKTNGMNGCKSKSYLVTYQNGSEVKRENISTDVYKSRDKVVHVGTKKVQAPAPAPPAVQEPAPAPTPESTPTPEENTDVTPES